MTEYKKPQSEKEFERNFSQIKPLMNDTAAYYESARCLFCYDAPCIKACPTHIDIPLFIRQIHEGNKTGAAKTIYESNYLGNACGKVCPTEVLCEGACVYNHQGVKPIEIGRLQNYASDHVLQHDIDLYDKGQKKDQKVAVIGAGPAGLSCACELSKMGYRVTIYEAKEKSSGLVVYGVAPYKISNEEVIKETDYLQKQFGYELIYNQPIRNKEDILMLEERYDAVFLGIGLGKTRSIKLPGEDYENCIGATEFIENLRMKHHQVPVGKKVIVLGGGNTAMDAASEVARMGAEEVILAYRGSKEVMSAYAFEYDLAKAAGVRGDFHLLPLEIVGEGKVEGVRFVRTYFEGEDLVQASGTTFVETCDMVILATGQEKQVEILGQIPDIEIDKEGRVCVNAYYQTKNPKYFAGGDMVNGGAEVVHAVAEGIAAARGIHKYLES